LPDLRRPVSLPIAKLAAAGEIVLNLSGTRSVINNIE